MRFSSESLFDNTRQIDTYIHSTASDLNIQLKQSAGFPETMQNEMMNPDSLADFSSVRLEANSV